MKNKIFIYYIVCVTTYITLFLVQLYAVHFVMQLLQMNMITNVFIYLALLLFVNPVITYFLVEVIMKKIQKNKQK